MEMRQKYVTFPAELVILLKKEDAVFSCLLVVYEIRSKLKHFVNISMNKCSIFPIT